MKHASTDHVRHVLKGNDDDSNNAISLKPITLQHCANCTYQFGLKVKRPFAHDFFKSITTNLSFLTLRVLHRFYNSRMMIDRHASWKEALLLQKYMVLPVVSMPTGPVVCRT